MRVMRKLFSNINTNVHAGILARTCLCVFLTVVLLANPMIAFAGESGGDSTFASYRFNGKYRSELKGDGITVFSESKLKAAFDSDMNAVLAEGGGNVHLSDETVTKDGDASDSDIALQYGTNAAVLAVNSASRVIADGLNIVSDGICAPAIFATGEAAVEATGVYAETTNEQSPCIVATYGGEDILSQLSAVSGGNSSPTVFAGSGQGEISIVSGKASTAGVASALFDSYGIVEVAGIEGTADRSPIATLRDEGVVRVRQCNLSSNRIFPDSNGGKPCAVSLIGSADINENARGAVFSGFSSELASAASCGSFFDMRGGKASIALESCSLNFDDAKVDLLRVGKGTETDGATYSALAELILRNQDVRGNISVERNCGVEVFLRDGSAWKGSVKPAENIEMNTGVTGATVNVQAGCTWVVTEDCRIDSLNIESGASLIDEQGRDVTIIDGNGKRISGNSSISVRANAVSFSLPDGVSISEAQITTMIDRSEFNSQFGSDSSFDGDVPEFTEMEPAESRVPLGVGGFLKKVLSDFFSLFGV